MVMTQRLRQASRAGLIHLLISAALASLVALLVFRGWFPPPFDQTMGGRELFWLIIGVDVVCGPLLTMVVFNTAKPRRELVRDLAVIAALQLGALAYGLHSMALARPVFVAFERDRFRVVARADIDDTGLSQASVPLPPLGFHGPEWLGVTMMAPTDPAYPRSIEMALQGLHPAFRPQRWVSYESQAQAVREGMRPLPALIAHYTARRGEIDALVQREGVAAEQLGYLPLITDKASDWVVVVRRVDAKPVGYLPLDGWAVKAP